MRKKLFVLGLSLLGVSALYVAYNTRDFGLCAEHCASYVGKYQEMFVIFPFVLFFSLVTFKLRDEIFIKWLRFSQISIPIILSITFLISLELHHNPGGFMNFDESIDYTVQNIIYILYTLGSIIVIYRGYKKGKVEGRIGQRTVDARPFN